MNELFLKFPVICFWRDLVRLRTSWEALTTTKKAGVKNGMFRDLLVVDSQGKCLRVKNAHKLHGVGLFWGYNIFMNQRIKVELELSGEPFNISLEEIKRMMFESFQRWHGWRSRGDFDELKASIEKAKSVSEIMERLSSPSYAGQNRLLRAKS
jgi:hypothetical protein